jgi:hypothetical protein
LFYVAKFFFYLEEEGNAALAHHLPADFVGNCILASASATDCRLVETDSASRKSKTEKFDYTYAMEPKKEFFSQQPLTYKAAV